MIKSEKYEELLGLVWDKTLSGGIDWQYNPDDKVFAKVGRTDLVIDRDLNDELDLTYKVYIFVGDRVVDSFSDVDLKNSAPKGDFGTYFDMMGAIFETAKRKATGADEGLDAAISDLKAIFSF